jgi:hypothetical protein
LMDGQQQRVTIVQAWVIRVARRYTQAVL